jgi:thioredoxin 1
MKRRELFVDCPHSRKVREKRRRLPGRALRGRGKPLKDQGKREETKSLLEHLIRLTQGDESGDLLMAGKPLRTKNMADNTIQSATDGNFEAEVLTASNSQPVMVDFWAEWCRPCHMLAPTVAEIAHDYAGKLKVMKLNVDEAMNSAGRYRVQGIPTLLLFKNGQVVEQIVGAVPKEQITKALERHIA